jgi:geranylgeranyl reductase family protein
MNTRAKFDVIIVGAGPAGSSAAHSLATKGFKVILLDRAIFPREKLCGGLLSARSEKIFTEIYQESWTPTIEIVAHGVEFFDKERRVNKVANYKPMYFTCRSKFDAYLLEMTEARGALVKQGALVTAVDMETGTVTLKSGQSLTADFVIGADGVNGRVVRHVFPGADRRSQLAFGLELEVAREDFPRMVLDPEIYFEVIRWGYGWIFRKSETLTMGIGGLLAENSDFKGLFESFLCTVCGRVLHEGVRGHHIPWGSYLRVPGRRNVLLVGDAAGLVEPITGEGIGFAMQSGAYAAEAIIDAARLGRPHDAITFYQARYRNIIDGFAVARFLRPLIFSRIAEPIFLRAIELGDSAIKRHMDLLAGDLDYWDYARFILRKVVTGGVARMIFGRP